MEWQQIRLFISSTFRDMYYEREFLVKNVLPELKNWCLERRLILNEIDLRWGVTESMAQTQRLTVYKCLRGVDASRPFFLCFLGQYRGWMPQRGDLQPPTLEDYPALAAMIGLRSATEMEIFRALEKAEPQPACDALFFHRELRGEIPAALRSNYTNEATADETLRARDDEAVCALWRDILPSLGYTPVPYCARFEGERVTDFQSGGKPLAQVLLPMLKAAILRRFPEREHARILPPDAAWADEQRRRLYWLTQEQPDEDTLRKEARRLGLPPPGETADALTRLEESWAASGGRLLLAGEAGCGRSTLFAHWVSKLHPEALYGFCAPGGDPGDLLARLLTAAGEPPPAPDERFGLLAARLAAACRARGAMLAIDGLERFPVFEATQLLSVPELRILGTVRRGCDAGNALLEWADAHGTSVFGPPSLWDASRLRLSAAIYLERYLKSLDEAQMRLLFSKPGTANPLYLRIVLSELRMFGSFEELNAQLESFGPDAESAFDSVLARLESDYRRTPAGGEWPGRIFALLAASPDGLTEAVWRGALPPAGPDDPLTMILRQVEPFMERRPADGETIFDFAYDAFRGVAEARYRPRLAQAHEALRRAYAAATGGPRYTGGTLRQYERLFFHARRTGGEGALVASWKYQHERLKRGGLTGLIRDLAGVGARENADFLLRHAGGLTAHADSLLSLLLLEGGPLRASAARQAAEWTEPYWSCEKAVVAAPPSEPQSAEPCAEPVFARELINAYASDLAMEALLLFRYERSGEVSVYDVSQGTPTPALLPVRKGRALRLRVSPDASRLAVAFDDGGLAVYSLRFTDRKPGWCDLVFSGECLLPETDDPALEWEGNALLWQRSDGAVLRSSFAEDGEETVWRTPLELALAAAGVCAFRDGTRTLLRRGQTEQAFPSLPVALCETDGGFALALTDGSVRLLDARTLETRRVVPKTPPVKDLAWHCGVLCLATAAGEKAPDGFYAFDEGCGLRAVRCAEPMYPGTLLQRIARVGFDAQGDFHSLSNVRYRRLRIVADGGAAEHAAIAHAFTAEGSPFAVIETESAYHLCGSDRVYASLAGRGSRLRWASCGRTAAGIARSANEPVARLSASRAEWVDAGKTMTDIAGGGVLWLLDERGTLSRLEDGGPPLGVPYSGAFRAQSVSCFGPYVVLTALDAAGAVIGPRLRLFRQSGGRLESLAALFFPANEGHYQCGLADGDTGLFHAFFSDGRGALFMRRFRAASGAPEGGDVPLPFLRSVAQVFMTGGIFCVREIDGSLTAMTAGGKRLCGMLPLTGTENLFGGEPPLLSAGGSLWFLRVVSEP